MSDRTWREELGPSFPFLNSAASVEWLLASVDGLGAEGVVYGLETTGHYWLPFYAVLAARRKDVKVINPIQSDSIRSLYIRVTKTDRKDAFLIA